MYNKYYPKTSRAIAAIGSAYRGYQRYAPTVRAIYNSASNAMAKLGKRKRTLQGSRRATKRPRYTAKSGGAGKNLTKQRDVTSSRRRKPSAKNRKWKSFVSKVNKAVLSNDKTHHLLEHPSNVTTVVAVAIGPAVQYIVPTTMGTDADFTLLTPGFGTSGVAKFVNLLKTNLLIPTLAGSVPTIGQNQFQKYFVTNCHMTIAIRNTTNNQNIHVDIYECLANQDINTAEVNWNTAQKAWAQQLTDTNVIDAAGATGAKSVQTDSGCTPYNAPLFQKYWKILKKTRVWLGPDDYVNHEVYGAKANVGVATVVGDYATKYKTKDLLIVVNPTENDRTAVSDQLIAIEWTKNYSIKFPDMQGTQSVYSWTNTL